MSDEEVEVAARAMYGKGWDGPPEKMPGERMKDVWRRYARAAIEAVDTLRSSRNSANCAGAASPLSAESGENT